MQCIIINVSSKRDSSPKISEIKPTMKIIIKDDKKCKCCAHMWICSHNVFTWVSVSGSLAIISAKICSTPVATSSTDDRPDRKTQTHTHTYCISRHNILSWTFNNLINLKGQYIISTMSFLHNNTGIIFGFVHEHVCESVCALLESKLNKTVLPSGC